MLNKKGSGLIGAIFLFIFFLIMWFIWLGKWLADIGQQAVTENGLTGLNAFFYSNLNFIILIIMCLAMIGWTYFGAGE